MKGTNELHLNADTINAAVQHYLCAVVLQSDVTVLSVLPDYNCAGAFIVKIDSTPGPRAASEVKP